jgi:hypothetical protein
MPGEGGGLSRSGDLVIARDPVIGKAKKSNHLTADQHGLALIGGVNPGDESDKCFGILVGREGEGCQDRLIGTSGHQLIGTAKPLIVEARGEGATWL